MTAVKQRNPQFNRLCCVGDSGLDKNFAGIFKSDKLPTLLKPTFKALISFNGFKRLLFKSIGFIGI